MAFPDFGGRVGLLDGYNLVSAFDVGFDMEVGVHGLLAVGSASVLVLVDGSDTDYMVGEGKVVGIGVDFDGL